MKNNLINLVILSLTFIACNSNKEQNINKTSSIVDSIQVEKTELADDHISKRIDSSHQELNTLPIHGELNRDDLTKYYPKVTDEIKDKRIFGSEKNDLNSGNGISVSLLHNTGTFDELIICTHDKSLELIDHLYVGKATDFDNGKSHTIESEINQHEIVFHQVDWGFVKNGNEEEEIDTVKYEIWTISIDKNGKIIYHKTVVKNNESDEGLPKENDSLFTLDIINAENFVRINIPIKSDFSLPDDSAKTELFKFADFNGDKKNDVLVYLGACGTGGCMYGLFLNQYDNYYELAFIDYLKNPTFEKEENGFLAIKSFEEIEPYDPSKLNVSIFRFDSNQYQIDTTFVYDDTTYDE